MLLASRMTFGMQFQPGMISNTSTRSPTTAASKVAERKSNMAVKSSATKSTTGGSKQGGVTKSNNETKSASKSDEKTKDTKVNEGNNDSAFNLFTILSCAN